MDRNGKQRKGKGEGREGLIVTCSTLYSELLEKPTLLFQVLRQKLNTTGKYACKCSKLKRWLFETFWVWLNPQWRLNCLHSTLPSGGLWVTLPTVARQIIRTADSLSYKKALRRHMIKHQLQWKLIREEFTIIHANNGPFLRLKPKYTCIQ